MSFQSTEDDDLRFFGAALFFVGVAITLVATKISPRAKSQLQPPADHHESRIDDSSNILLLLSASMQDLDPAIAKDFCGRIIGDATTAPDLSGKNVYLCGDISSADISGLSKAARVFIIREFSQNYDQVDCSWLVVNRGRVPLHVHGVGVFFREFFDADRNYFQNLCRDHEFQSLTESNKPGTAHRTGIYLTPVTVEGEDVHFNLLRCSSNLSGPTGNFRANDRRIVNALNEEANYLFEDNAPLNHVLAQVYINTPAMSGKKETKAKIKDHSDKTKDMPDNGIMAFCTFYDKLDKLTPFKNGFDYGHKNLSGLTTLHFRLKPCVANRPGCTLTPHFVVPLYPNSVFLMPLSTNRLYTHEIRPSALGVERLPTRLGYVVRCSNTQAVFRDGQTFLKTKGSGSDQLVKLKPPTKDDMTELRHKYALENATDDIINYGEVSFSMNKGDYERPLVYGADVIGTEFRTVPINQFSENNMFEDLQKSAKFEGVCKGRLGAVLVKPDFKRGVPIVRTTTKYSVPAQCFKPVHEILAENIQQAASIATGFDNALIEIYTNSYAKMGFHSDQALDLEDGSHIAVYSCYKFPELAMPPPRKLVIESKEPGGGTMEIPMAHNSAIVFSLDTNKRFKHKIVLDSTMSAAENEWLGVTLRKSKTFVKFADTGNEGPRFEDGSPLKIADSDETKEFYQERHRENLETDYSYPTMIYTISASDTQPPIVL